MRPWQFWGIPEIEKRILELKRARTDEELIEKAPGGFPVPDLPPIPTLQTEIDTLETERKFIHENHQVFVSVTALVVSLFIAFFVPPWTQSLKQEEGERAEVQSLYQTIVANGDIFTSNSGAIQNAENGKEAWFLPESFIDFPVENIHEKLQRGLGIDQYRFLLYYLDLTRYLNNQIGQIEDMSIVDGIATSTRSVGLYSNLKALDKDGWEEPKFSYGSDTECLMYMLKRAFPYITMAKRDKGVKCSSDSLNRIGYHFGVIVDEVPQWLVPDMKAAMNARKPGLGDTYFH